MKKLLISKIRKEFLNLKNTKEDCQSYMKTALEEKGFKQIKKGEFSSCIDDLSNESDDILALIKEQENILEKNSVFFSLPKFFIRSFIVKRKTKNMKKSFVNFVHQKSDYSFDEYKNINRR